MLTEGWKVRVSKDNYKKAFSNNGTNGVDSFIEANSQPKRVRKSPSKAYREYNTHKEQVKFSGKIDLSNVSAKLKKITKVVNNKSK